MPEGAWEMVGRLGRESRTRKLLGPGKQLFGEFGDYLKGLQGQAGERTYFTPAEIARLQQDLTAQPLSELERGFGRRLSEGRGRLTSEYAARGNLFGGSLTGAQARLESGLGEEYLAGRSRILGDVTGRITEQDIMLGFQKQQQAQQLIDALLRQYMGGQFNILSANAGKQGGGGFFSSLLPIIGAAIGTAIAPGAGTAIGAGLGSGAGSSFNPRDIPNLNYTQPF